MENQNCKKKQEENESKKEKENKNNLMCIRKWQMKKSRKKTWNR